MARRIGILTALTVKNLTKPGLYADGGGLYLQVGPSGAKSWIFRFMLKRTARSMGLGALHTVSLAEARQVALECRKKCRDGIDPIDERALLNAKAIQSSCPTFMECAEAYILAHEVGWRNSKHAAQWRSTLQTYAGPIFGGKPVDEVNHDLVLQVLEPIWNTKTETASRVRGRIEAVLDWAKAKKYRSGENPASWSGNLKLILPARSKVQKVKHHSALAYDQIPQFVKALREHVATAARAFEFLILTAARTGEVIGARWSEVDLDQRVWVIPADRMKANKEHRVPLTPQAMQLIGKRPVSDGPSFLAE